MSLLGVKREGHAMARRYDRGRGRDMDGQDGQDEQPGPILTILLIHVN